MCRAREDLQWRALRPDAVTVAFLYDDRHPLAFRVEGDLPEPCGLAELALDVVAPLLRQHEKRALGRITEDHPASIPVVDQPGVVAVEPRQEQGGQRFGKVRGRTYAPAFYDLAGRRVTNTGDLELVPCRPDGPRGHFARGQRPGLV